MRSGRRKLSRNARSEADYGNRRRWYPRGSLVKDGSSGFARRVSRTKVQRLLKTTLTLEQYVAQEYWSKVVLGDCPLHPEGGCGLAKHGVYWRKHPVRLAVPRWYCFVGHVTISMLPVFLAARMAGTLAELEEAVVTSEQAETQVQAADALRSPTAGDEALTLEASTRWLRRRVRAVQACLLAVLGIYSERFAGIQASITAFRLQLGCDAVLVTLREIAEDRLVSLPPPLGFGPRAQPRRQTEKGPQHKLCPALGP